MYSRMIGEIGTEESAVGLIRSTILAVALKDEENSFKEEKAKTHIYFSLDNS